MVLGGMTIVVFVSFCSVQGLLPLFCHGALSATDRLDLFHSLFHRRLCKICSLFELFQDTGALILLLKSLYRTIDRFIFRNDDSYQRVSPPFMRVQWLNG
jgi:hypothetical protein